jgi:fucose permease
MSVYYLFLCCSFAFLLKKVKKIAGIRSGLPAHAISAMLFLPANVSYFSLF